MNKTVYTVGTSNRSLKDFVSLLHEYGIKHIVDIRRFPTSIEKVLRRHNFLYFYMGMNSVAIEKGVIKIM